MSNRQTNISHRDRDGRQLQVTSQETDSPILPVGQLKTLHEFRPDLVDWVVRSTESEAKSRRDMQSRVNMYVFIERIGGLVFGTLVAVFGLGIAAYLALHGAERVAIVLGGGTLASIVWAIVSGKRNSSMPEQQNSAGNQRKKANRN